MSKAVLLACSFFTPVLSVARTVKFKNNLAAPFSLRRVRHGGFRLG